MLQRRRLIGCRKKAFSDAYGGTTVSCLASALLALSLVIPREALVSPSDEGRGTLVAEGKRDLQAEQTEQMQLTVTGERVSMANGVECTKIRTDDGEEVAVSYLAPSIAIGARVTVTGVMANMPTCLGPVLRVQSVEVLSEG